MFFARNSDGAFVGHVKNKTFKSKISSVDHDFGHRHGALGDVDWKENGTLRYSRPAPIYDPFRFETKRKDEIVERMRLGKGSDNPDMSKNQLIVIFHDQKTKIALVHVVDEDRLDNIHVPDGIRRKTAHEKARQDCLKHNQVDEKNGTWITGGAHQDGQLVNRSGTINDNANNDDGYHNHDRASSSAERKLLQKVAKLSHKNNEINLIKQSANSGHRRSRTKPNQTRRNRLNTVHKDGGDKVGAVGSGGGAVSDVVGADLITTAAVIPFASATVGVGIVSGIANSTQCPDDEKDAAVCGAVVAGYGSCVVGGIAAYNVGTAATVSAITTAGGGLAGGAALFAATPLCIAVAGGGAAYGVYKLGKTLKNSIFE